MNFSKLSFVSGNFFGASIVGLVIVACGGGGSGGSTGGIPIDSTSPLNTINANQILINNGTTVAAGKDGIIRIQANQLPSNVTVSASNVNLNTSQNNLSATNLQSALDSQLTANIALILPGTWKITNYGGSPGGSAAMGSGSISIDGNLNVTSFGSPFAAIGACSKSNVVTQDSILKPTSFSRLSDGLLLANTILTYTNTTTNISTSAKYQYVAQIASINTNQIVIVGASGGVCDGIGYTVASVLTRVGASTPTSYNSEKKTYSSNLAINTKYIQQ